MYTFTAVFFVFIHFVGSAYGYDPAETIVDVEATSNSLIIHTDAAGGTAGLRNLIEIYDLAAHELQIRTLDLSGPTLENSRGQPSISCRFLISNSSGNKQ